MVDIDKEELNNVVLPSLLPTAKLEAKKMALDFVLSYSETAAGKQEVSSAETLKNLMSLTEDADKEVSKKAFSTLINLLADSDDIAVRFLKIPEHEELGRKALGCILDRDFESADMLCMLLSNATRTEECAAVVAKFFIGDSDLVEKMVSALVQLKYNSKGAYLHHLALVLCNLSQITDVRTLMLNQEKKLITKLMPFLSFEKSTIRRKGCAGTIKNCCFDTGYHEWLLSEDVDLLPYLLLPLAGPEEFDDEDNAGLPIDLQYLPPDKKREPDNEIRKMLVEAIFQLCATKKGRTYIKDNNAYIIMRELHQWETDKANDIAIQNLVDILIGDEPAKEHENLSNVEIPEDLKDKFLKEDEEDMESITKISEN